MFLITEASLAKKAAKNWSRKLYMYIKKLNFFTFFKHPIIFARELNQQKYLQNYANNSKRKKLKSQKTSAKIVLNT